MDNETRLEFLDLKITMIEYMQSLARHLQESEYVDPLSADRDIEELSAEYNRIKNGESRKSLLGKLTKGERDLLTKLTKLTTKENDYDND